MKSRAAILALVLVALAAAGSTMRLVMPKRPSDGAAGGWRTFAADLAWLQASVAWENREATRAEALLKLTVALDPQPLYYWLNGARIMAYDVPAWRIADAGDAGAGDADRRERIRADAARRALVFLGRAEADHPKSAALWIERGNIELNALHELSAAAECYRRASEQPGAPYFAARLHAEMLRRLGRKAEALASLEKIYPRLPPGDEAAAADVVLARIRALECELGVPAASAFAPAQARKP